MRLRVLGKVECSVYGFGVDLLSFSGHKFYAPKGIGGLFVRMGVAVEPIFFGEGNEGGLRPGTENVPHIVGLGQAAKLMQSGAQSSLDRLAEMRDRFRCQLESLLGISLNVVGDHALRLPHVLTFELPRVTAKSLQQRLPEICFVLCHGARQSCGRSLESLRFDGYSVNCKRRGCYASRLVGRLQKKNFSKHFN